LRFTQQLISLRREQPLLRGQHYSTGQNVPELDIPDLSWFKVDGTEVSDGEWGDPLARSLAMRVAGVDDTAHEATSLLLLLNAYWEELPFVLPEAGWRPI